MGTKLQNNIAITIIRVIAALVVLILVLLLGKILIAGVPHISWHFLTAPSQSFESGGGIGVQLFNSIYLLVLTLIISFPISLGAGIFLSEYAPKNFFTAVVRMSIEVLSSLPSVVVGLFGFLLFVVQFQMGFSILSGAVALTFFNLPLLTRNIEESLRAVPNLQREAGMALGLSKWRTVTKIILPEALPGIITGVVLGAGRVFGEAAALIYTAGQSATNIDFGNWNPFNSASPLNLLRPAETLAVHIWKINSEGVMPDAAAVSAGSSAVLIIAVLIFNLLARVLGNSLYRKLTATK
ncbi:phosphate ABC transporter permease PstA [Liquorilactobacillus satsumensis]|uniref:Phosphate transport system permease protein PstA n=1 Tax=Liquorilactobacillus satsumensis DSM 16230 = JCM 12392 TaxID=1423801 RepID=A0A0R1UXT2_9LACO|nr:phosphate ABC transporter permease PstA [Liquorilactobacillus satsumensis]KRL98092.1 phosphate ABC transporter permease [Liquorilactobacillus satsumensis DSM 16230 = JCM 12392]MCC7667346.1 phosphate ABC transporter, permease protein PstA [Liquorilactobacillus satsumensis]MCP9313777.1 phosphate ABC transporter permease PstA [Liquorilactobacillus satsumensis]MCP9329457.1 phosphate ABC transporter permease PstA [Liquorilactobacillus satsumensis]MCP9358214.1 phosphate ABC transporter permease P